MYYYDGKRSTIRDREEPVMEHLALVGKVSRVGFGDCFAILGPLEDNVFRSLRQLTGESQLPGSPPCHFLFCTKH